MESDHWFVRLFQTSPERQAGKYLSEERATCAAIDLLVLTLIAVCALPLSSPEMMAQITDSGFVDVYRAFVTTGLLGGSGAVAAQITSAYALRDQENGRSGNW